MDSETPKVLASAGDLVKKLNVDLDEMIKLATSLRADLSNIEAELSNMHRTAVATGSLPVESPPQPSPHPKPVQEPQPPPPHPKEDKATDKKH